MNRPNRKMGDEYGEIEDGANRGSGKALAMFDKEQLLRVVFGRLDWEVNNSTSIDERLWIPAFAGMTARQFTLVLKPEVLTYLREPIF